MIVEPTVSATQVNTSLSRWRTAAVAVAIATMFSPNLYAGESASLQEWKQKNLRLFGGGVGSRTYALSACGQDNDSAGTLSTIGKQPSGYDNKYIWKRKHREVRIAAYINAADPRGVSILNLKPGDQIEVTSAGGIASFSESTGRSTPSIIGAVGKVGAEFAAKAFGRGTVGKRRDAFGMDDRGKYQRCEGGVVVALPGAGEPYNSWEGCTREKRARTDDMRPKHVKSGFFLVRNGVKRGHNKRQVRHAGEAYILAWDRKFSDNKGYYQLRIRLIRNDAVKRKAANQVTIYQHSGFRTDGKYRSFSPGRYDMHQLGIGNDQLESLKVPSGMCARLFWDWKFRGPSRLFTSSSSNVGRTWSDATSSMIVGRGVNGCNNDAVKRKAAKRVTIYQHSGFRTDGKYRSFSPGRYDMHQLGIGNDQLESLKVPSGMCARLFWDWKFRGPSRLFTSSSANVGRTWSDTTSSMIVGKGANACNK